MTPGSRDLVTFGVPIDCVGAPSADDPLFGTELSPAALRSAGLIAALGGVDDGDLDVRLTGQIRDPDNGVQGWPGVREVTRAVRDRVRGVVSAGGVPVLVGGCCTPLPGALAGARDVIGSVGLAYLDGHLDLYDGRTSTTGEPADMPVAVISGHGPRAWSSDVAAPVADADRIMLVGPRDRDEATALGSVLPEQLGMAIELTPTDLRRTGLAPTGASIAHRLAQSGGRYWVHLDVDVLDELEFPATDYLMPGGLTRAELTDLLGPLVSSAGLVGFSLGCYNPEKDPAGAGASYLVDLLGHAFR